MDSAPGTINGVPPHPDADRRFTSERLFGHQSSRIWRPWRWPGLFAGESTVPVVRNMVDIFRHETRLVSPVAICKIVLVLPAPWSFRSSDGVFQIESNAEISLGAQAAKIVSEVLAGNEVDPPDIGRSRRYRVNGVLISRKHLSCRRANTRRQAAVHRHAVRLAIFVAMIVLQQESVFLARQDPCSRTVFANNERNSDAILLA
jgi:hypothetical protein